MEYLAHSARDGFREQSYTEHINNVIHDALQNARTAAEYAKNDGELLVWSVYNAALYHDLGKLCDENQKALQKKDSGEHLPVHHQDAGVAQLAKLSNSCYSQLAVASHHSGLPDMPREMMRKNGTIFRDGDYETREKTKAVLSNILERHNQLVSSRPHEVKDDVIHFAGTFFSRILLSCLTDADHTDTGRHYNSFPTAESMPKLRARERLECLDAYVHGMKYKGSQESERNTLRREMYETCRHSVMKESIVFCDSPVGSGKTTAIMANMLRHAIESGARRIFVVLPFTSVIEQSVSVYRKALVLPGENPESIVSELHHRAEFENDDLRALSSNWRAPIIVTTAVAFFETLASNRPAVLRKLHELPGSEVFIDEAHAAVPVKLLPVTWNWITELADYWSCYWVLASGSFVKFWEIEDLRLCRRHVPLIIPDELRKRLSIFEKRRIEYKLYQERLTVDRLIEFIASKPGPRLVIMNTVKNAAIVASKLYEKAGSNHVMHISTALKSVDRKKTIEKIKEWIEDKNRSDWTLVATSCVEAGVDFSFKTGFREVGSLSSLLQTAGRINRSGKDDGAEVWSFQMRDDEVGFVSNPLIQDSAEVLMGYFHSDTRIIPELSTDAISRELMKSSVVGIAKKLLRKEQDQCFKEVNDSYHIIDNDSVIVIVDEDLKQSIRHGGCEWKEIQKNAVSISRYKAKEYNLRELACGIYDWDLNYDSFLGIMRGVLDKDTPMFC